MLGAVPHNARNSSLPQAGPIAFTAYGAAVCKCNVGENL